MKLTFEAPGPVLSTNESNRQHWAQRRRYLDPWKEAAFWYAKANKLGSQPPSVVTMHIPFAVNRRRDPSNYVGTVVKACVDGLVLAGVFEDDNPNFVRVAEPVLCTGSTVTIELEAFDHG